MHRMHREATTPGAPTGSLRTGDRRPDDDGFSLVELMVVLLVLAILLAIAIPTFLGVSGGANDKAAQSNLNTALTTAKAYATQNGRSYGTVPATVQSALASSEPSISWFVGGASNTTNNLTTQGNISVWPSSDGNGIVLASPSKNGNACWYVVDNIAFVTGSATTNGAYTDTSASPGVTGTATSAPTKVGTFYGKSSGPCNAGLPQTTGTPFGASGANWASSFAAA